MHVKIKGKYKAEEVIRKNEKIYETKKTYNRQSVLYCEKSRSNYLRVFISIETFANVI